MDGFNEKSTEQVQEQQPLGCLRRFSKTIKVIIIGGLIILLMIPMFMIEDLISERGRTQEEAINEVSEKWSLAQTITGPYLNIQYPVTTENNGEKKVSIKDLFLFPDELLVNGQLKTEILKRSIYEVNVYQSELTLKGSFSPEELIKSRQNIMQTVTHDLRSPLTAIRGNAELILKDGNREATALHAEHIRQSAERMGALMENLLDYYRIDNGKETVRVKPFRLAGVAETLETEFAARMEERRLEFRVNNAADEVVMGDRNLILRIGSNLLSNALKFTERGGVTLTALYAGGKFTLAVEDTGGGIDRLGGCSVLSLDNDGIILGMIHDIFVQNGVHCDTCTSTGEMAEKLREGHYDLLTTDLKMQDASGYEVLELLRTSDIGNSRTIPVMVVTGSKSITKEELAGAGFGSVLYKPFSIDELLAAAEECIGEDSTPRIDLGPLFAYGDKRQRLECLVRETEKEMAAIREEAERCDRDRLDYWIHHIRSSWMLIHAEGPLQELYDVLHGNGTAEEIREYAGKVTGQGETIIRLARKEMERTVWEE